MLQDRCPQGFRRHFSCSIRWKSERGSFLPRGATNRFIFSVMPSCVAEVWSDAADLTTWTMTDLCLSDHVSCAVSSRLLFSTCSNTWAFLSFAPELWGSWSHFGRKSIWVQNLFWQSLIDYIGIEKEIGYCCENLVHAPGFTCKRRFMS